MIRWYRLRGIVRIYEIGQDYRGIKLYNVEYCCSTETNVYESHGIVHSYVSKRKM